MSSNVPRSVNRLAREKSPYLQQHKHNPVDWYPWAEEAFDRARRLDKPVFLSIGYSTCHWCHVMERESFENRAIADFLNEHFVSIKLDREERPDLDKIYMTFVQAMTGQGGWPLNVFLTPLLKPFYGGTYWPPENKYGRPGFLQVLMQVQKAWHDRKDQLSASATELHGKLMELLQRAAPEEPQLSEQIIREAGRQLKEGFDAENGGWGTAPKFPSPSHPSFVLQYGARFNDKQAVEMVLHTCERMASGGIYDQLGGGFHRYSVDQYWLVPHFEKMLYDNAQLLDLYLDCFLVSNEQGYADVAHNIARYVLRDMTAPEGGFYSAEDADSEGHEGKFYCWTRAELEPLLTPEEFNVAVKFFGITAEGNFMDHSAPDPLPAQNVLSVADDEFAPGDEELLLSARRKMLESRNRRVRPLRDDKVLASWNGLMLGALARASVVLDSAIYRAAAGKNCAFLKQHLWDAASATLYHRWREGERDSAQLLDAYAYFLQGVVSLYEATLDPQHLAFAIALADSMVKKFYDAKDGGFWQSPADTQDLILRVKEDYDGAQPSGNSVAVLALLKLAGMTGRADYREAAEKTLRFFSERMEQMPQAAPYMLKALDFSLQEPTRSRHCR